MRASSREKPKQRSPSCRFDAHQCFIIAAHIGIIGRPELDAVGATQRRSGKLHIFCHAWCACSAVPAQQANAARYAVRHRASPALIAQDRSAVRYRGSESERMKPARTQALTPLHSLHFPRTTLTALKTDASAHVLRRENRGSNLKKGTYELQTFASADFDACNHDFLS